MLDLYLGTFTPESANSAKTTTGSWSTNQTSKIETSLISTSVLVGRGQISIAGSLELCIGDGSKLSLHSAHIDLLARLKPGKHYDLVLREVE